MNSILWKNTATQGGPQIAAYPQSIVQVSYSTVEGSWPGTQIYTADPQFVHAGNDDYHLTFRSPCLDKGDPYYLGLPASDFEGDPRKTNGKPDVGADEFHTHLYVIGNPTPGGSVQIKAIGGSSNVAQLGIAFAPLNPPLNIPGVGSFRLLPPFALLTIIDPQNARVPMLPFQFSYGFPTVTVYFQALIDAKLSNLEVMVVK